MTATGTANKNTMWVNNSGTWVEFNHYEYFRIKKRQNQVSEFEIKIFDISTAQKAYFKEQAEVLFFAGTTMILKGKIQTIEYGSSYEVIARGIGLEVLLLNKELIKSGDNRIQYSNESAQTIAQEINGGILTTASSGLWASDYGNVSLRFEYANRLNALGKLAEAINYDWWVSQVAGDDYATNYLNVSSNQGETSSQKTFSVGSNSTKISQEKDINGLVNYVYALGYGDGINQLSTSCYAASTQSSLLNANIEATNTSIDVIDGSVFDATGTARIADEQITYAGITTNTLTGTTRGVNSTTARSHDKNCYIEQHYTTTSAQTGSSILTYGLMDKTIIDKTIIDRETLEVAASGYLLDRRTPTIRIKIESDEPITDVTLDIGDNVTVTDSEADVSGDYRVVGQEFESNYGFLKLTSEVSNRSLEFLEQMDKARQDQEAMSRYMQGSTNIYAISEAENCDSNHPLNMRIYIPDDAVTINKVSLNFKIKNYRIYTTGLASGIFEEIPTDPRVMVQVGAEGSERLFAIADNGTATSGGNNTLTDTGQSWDVNEWENYALLIVSGTGNGQLRLIESNTSDILTLNTQWETNPDSTSVYEIAPTYSTDQTELDISEEIKSVGAGNWNNIKFTPAPTSDIPDVLYFKLDSSSGTNVADYSGSGHNGTAENSAGWTTGYYGNGYDCSSYNITVASHADFDFDGDFTIQCWIKPNVLTEGEDFIYNRVEDGSNFITFEIGQSPSKIYFQIEDDTHSNVLNPASADYLTVGNWHHISIVGDRTAGTLILYVDGEVADSTALDATPNWADSDPVYIGSAASGAAHFDGTLDEFKIWSSARTATQVKKDSSSADRLRIESNAYVKVFIEST